MLHLYLAGLASGVPRPALLATWHKVTQNDSHEPVSLSLATLSARIFKAFVARHVGLVDHTDLDPRRDTLTVVPSPSPAAITSVPISLILLVLVLVLVFAFLLVLVLAFLVKLVPVSILPPISAALAPSLIDSASTPSASLVPSAKASTAGGDGGSGSSVVRIAPSGAPSSVTSGRTLSSPKTASESDATSIISNCCVVGPPPEIGVVRHILANFPRQRQGFALRRCDLDRVRFGSRAPITGSRLGLEIVSFLRFQLGSTAPRRQEFSPSRGIECIHVVPASASRPAAPVLSFVFLVRLDRSVVNGGVFEFRLPHLRSVRAGIVAQPVDGAPPSLSLFSTNVWIFASSSSI